MSKSRLEKFLYALYSLDSSDLPTPLSRIEELYKCLVTSEEAPSFEPISRVEKYLMAILGAYNVNELPNPLSRVEVLLYKLATGDDNLDGFDTFLSKHEELLAEIIRNGGAGGNINIEYVLYTLSTEFNTLYNTAEKPVKSAILKGNTLANVAKIKSATMLSNTQYSLTNIGLKGNTKYIFFFTHGGENGNMLALQEYKGESGWIVNNKISLSKLTPKQHYIFTTKEETRMLRVQNLSSTEFPCDNFMVIEYQDGMENWDIPYFEGMKSVQMPVLKTTGKNLISNWYNGECIDDTGTLINKGGQVGTDFITIPTQGDYVCEDLKNGTVRFFDSNKQLIEKKSSINKSFNVPTGVKYVTFNYYSETYPSNLQLEKGTQSTPYEPYKSNILTVNEDVELHGVGEVKDELDLVTGEVTKRVGEVVFDGSEDWVQSGMEDKRIFYTSINDMAHKENYQNSISCDKFVTYIGEGYLMYSAILNGITGYIDNTDSYPNENWMYIKLADSEGSVEKLKQWLSQNPVTVRYELATESVKTVDISVVDQDGNNTELKTFDDITYVTLSSEGLIPGAELEVATKNEEVLNTMSLEMDDISATQTTLKETSNTQSENVDATMIATTEIYEGLL